MDDEDDIRLVLRAALEKRGYIVDEAENGSVALQKIASSRPDLVILDIMMPILDGYSVNLRLKENPETATLPVIVITGKGTIGEFMKVRNELMVAAYLEKPFAVSMLVDKLQEILV